MRRFQKPAIQTVRPGMVRANESLALPAAARNRMASVLTRVEERVEAVLPIANHEDLLIHNLANEVVAR